MEKKPSILFSYLFVVLVVVLAISMAWIIFQPVTPDNFGVRSVDCLTCETLVVAEETQEPYCTPVPCDGEWKCPEGKDCLYGCGMVCVDNQVLPDRETGRMVDYGDPNLGDRVMTPTPIPGQDYGDTLPGWININGTIVENWDCFAFRKDRFVNCNYNLMRIAQIDTWDSSTQYEYIQTPMPTPTAHNTPVSEPGQCVRVLWDKGTTNAGLNLRPGPTMHNTPNRRSYLGPGLVFQPLSITNNIEGTFAEFGIGWWIAVDLVADDNVYAEFMTCE